MRFGSFLSEKHTLQCSNKNCNIIKILAYLLAACKRAKNARHRAFLQRGGRSLTEGRIDLTLLIFVLSSTGIGLTISAIADNMQQVLVYVFVLILPLALLSGIVTPIRNMPEALQLLTYADPLRFAVESIRRIYLEGAGFTDIAPNFIPMLAVAAVTLPLAGWLFRHKIT